jgi:hypothetical protein
MTVVCLFCHAELARFTPPARQLTAYYLCIALGGVIGGAFVALLAPRIFNRLLELPLGFLAAAGLAFACLPFGAVNRARTWAGLFLAAAVALAVGVPILQPWNEAKGAQLLKRSRNFYGTLAIWEGDGGGEGNPADLLREMRHGTTSHGAQYQIPERRHEPTLYYAPNSGVAFALRNLRPDKPRKVGLVGLGVGTLAAYGKPGDTFRFYEINPDVETMARKYFTFLADSPAATEVILGDARLTLEREADQQFDILVLDAFSGDAIPTHLLTAEAFGTYMRHLKQDGVLAVHFSNRSVALGPVLLRQAYNLNLSTSFSDASGWWMLMSRDRAILWTPEMRRGATPVEPRDTAPLWTDDYVPLLNAIRWVPNAPKPNQR